MLNRQRLRSVRRSVVVAFYMACVAIVLLAALLTVALLADPGRLLGIDGKRELVEVSGRSFKRRLDTAWPPDLDPATVEAVSYKHQWSRDSWSTWHRIQLTRDAARQWADYKHDRHIEFARWRQPHCRRVELMRRTLTGPPPLRDQTGETPPWWSPPAITFHATETMLWYDQFYSGVGRAVYSGYDDSTGTLWMYTYSAQHDLLWSPGDAPELE